MTSTAAAAQARRVAPVTLLLILKTPLISADGAARRHWLELNQGSVTDAYFVLLCILYVCSVMRVYPSVLHSCSTSYCTV